jgi:hypothetical protein
MTRILILLLAGVGVTLLPGDSPRAGCRSVVAVHHKQAAVVFAPQYAQPYYYSVGAPLQYAAMKEQIKAELRAEAQQLQAAPTPDALPITAEVDRWSLTKKYCQSCHLTNENARAALDMSDFSAISCDQKLDAIAACLDGAMPKGKPLPPDVLGNLLGEWAGAKTVQIP